MSSENKENLNSVQNIKKSPVIRPIRINDNEQTIVKHTPESYSTEDLRKYLKEKPETILDGDKDNEIPAWEIDRQHGAKVYELIGYATAGKIKQKSDRENRQFFLKRILIVALLVIVVILGLVIINPFKENSDWKRILGINSMFTENNETTNSEFINNEETNIIMDEENNQSNIP